MSLEKLDKELAGEGFEIPFASKVTSGTNNTAGIRFFNLEAGKVYKVTITPIIENQVGEDVTIQPIDPDGSTVIDTFGFLQNLSAGQTIISRLSASAIFTAQASGTLTWNLSTATGDLESGTKATLEELPFHKLTTKWDS